MSLTPQALRLLSRETAKLRQDPPEGVRIVLDEDDLTSMEGWVQGPEGTPYEGGYFKIRFEFGPEYPNVPPKCTMMTKIFHPNISKTGEICVDTLKKGWDKKYGVGHVLVTIKCLLIYPNPESALDEEAGKQLLADYQGYRKYATLITSIHATPKTPPAEFSASNASSSKAGPSQKAISEMTAKPSVPASTGPTLDFSSAPASALPKMPLGQSHVQETSPVVASSDTIPGTEKILKPMNTILAASVAKSAKAPPKRGLRRL